MGDVLKQILDELQHLRAAQNQTNSRLDNIEQVMATKEDLDAVVANMATKEDLDAVVANMATKEDIANMATKEDIEGLFAEQQQDILALLKVIEDKVNKVHTDIEYLSFRDQKREKEIFELKKDLLFREKLEAYLAGTK